MPKKSLNDTRKNKFNKGDVIILDGAEYEVIDYGNISWNGKMYKDVYSLWDTDEYGRIEQRDYVDNNAK